MSFVNFRIEGRASLRRGSGRIDGWKQQASIKDRHRASERPGRKQWARQHEGTANRITGSNVRLGTEMPVAFMSYPNNQDHESPEHGGEAVSRRASRSNKEGKRSLSPR